MYVLQYLILLWTTQRGVSYALGDSSIVNKLINGAIDETIENFNRIENINISLVNVQHLRKGSIKNLPTINTIILKHVGLRSMESFVFQNVPKLNKVEIVDNLELKIIPKEAFSGLRIEKLSLADNGIEILEKDAFTELENLIYLDLSENQLQEWDPNWIGTTSPNLEHIDLYFNKIKEIKKHSFRQWDKLKTINLLLCNIVRIDPQAFEGNFRLVRLDLAGNEIRTLEPNTIIGRTSSNTEGMSLDLCCNNLMYLPENFLRSLKNTTIELRDNPITCPCMIAMNMWKESNTMIIERCKESNKICLH